MAHFAKLDENNVVTNVIVIGNAVPTSNGPLGENDMHPDGEAYCTKLLGGKWKQTSYNHRFRKQYAGKGYTYDSVNDVFITPKPYPSWTLNSNFDWQPPVAMPLGKYRHYKTGEELEKQNGFLKVKANSNEVAFTFYSLLELVVPKNGVS